MGIFIEPSKELQLDCYVDADFSVLFGVKHDKDQMFVKSRTD